MVNLYSWKLFLDGGFSFSRSVPVFTCFLFKWGTTLCNRKSKKRGLSLFFCSVFRANACKNFCLKSLNYYLKNAQNGKILLGGIMLLRESLEEIDDFRVKRCRKFELADIFLLVLFGLLSGIKDIEHIAERP